MSVKEKNELIYEIVDYIISQGTQNSTSGSWIFYYYELQDKFNVSYDWLVENAEEIKDVIDGNEEILSETWDEFDEYMEKENIS